MLAIMVAESVGCFDKTKGSVSLENGMFTVTLYNNPEMTYCTASDELKIRIGVWQDNFTARFTYNRQQSASNTIKLTCANADFTDCDAQIKKYVQNDQVTIWINTTTVGDERNVFHNVYLLRVASITNSAIIGIVIGSIVGALALVGGVWWIVVYSKKKVAYKKFYKLDAYMDY